MKKETSSEKMSTISECIQKAVATGYDKDFFIVDGVLSYKNARRVYLPEEVSIRNFYRFEGESDPADSSILYLLRTDDGVKGVLLDAYGIYSDKSITGFVKGISDINKQQPRKKAGIRELLMTVAIVCTAWWLGKRLLSRRQKAASAA